MNLLAACRNWTAAVCLALATTPGAAPAQAPGATRDIEVKVVARKPVGGARTERVHRGDAIVLRVQSDEPLSVHVHGYDMHGEASPGSPASLSFVASWAGRFPVAAHLAKAHGGGAHGPEPTLLYLEVLPE